MCTSHRALRYRNEDKFSGATLGIGPVSREYRKFLAFPPTGLQVTYLALGW
jgi:hypothetical protein